MDSLDAPLFLHSFVFDFFLIMAENWSQTMKKIESINLWFSRQKEENDGIFLWAFPRPYF